MTGRYTWGRRLGAVVPIAALMAWGGTARADDLGPLGLVGNEPSYIDFGIGGFNVFNFGDRNQKYTTGAARSEFRYGRKLWYIGPAAGVMINAQGGAMVYGGFYSDFKVQRIVITPMLGLGAYEKGSSEDLGGVFEFRVGIGATYEFANGQRAGVQATHVSNAGTHHINPGDNELMLTYAFPLSF